MNIREACEDIMGEKLASSIIADPKLGLAWCVIAAMADPRNEKRPRACGVIRAWLAEQKIKPHPTENMPGDGGGQTMDEAAAENFGLTIDDLDEDEE